MTESIKTTAKKNPINLNRFFIFFHFNLYSVLVLLLLMSCNPRTCKSFCELTLLRGKAQTNKVVFVLSRTLLTKEEVREDCGEQSGGKAAVSIVLCILNSQCHFMLPLHQSDPFSYLSLIDKGFFFFLNILTFHFILFMC